MSLVIKNCPSSLAQGFDNYSPKALRELFGGKKVSCVQDFNSPKADGEISAKFIENRKILSISGVQVKQSIILEKNKLRLTEAGEQGTYILKPIPYGADFSMPEELPANENLTMQIASQVYDIETAANGLVFFKNGEPAYITKRFDISKTGSKVSQEDFAVLMGYSLQLQGNAFKYEGSYQSAAGMMKQFIPVYALEAEKYFERIIFNYLFCNGDAHLRNFSVQQLPSGDHVLTPAYDLVNTRLHIINDSAMALKNGLFENDYNTESFEKNGYFAFDDFFEFGMKIELIEKRLRRILDKFRAENSKVKHLISRSFLTENSKKIYYNLYIDRLKALNYSFSKKI